MLHVPVHVLYTAELTCFKLGLTDVFLVLFYVHIVTQQEDSE